VKPTGADRYDLHIEDGLLDGVCRPALIWATGIDAPQASDVPPEFLNLLLQRVAEAGETFVPSERRQRVRKMLRYGKYRPSGRGKPSSEYLLRAALGDSFPTVNGPVDVNNAISLESGLPASIFDVGLSGSELLLRRGRPAETYVFNHSGQTIDLEDLLLVCRWDQEMDDWVPCGNPVKDSMATKISPEARDVVAVLYVPADEPHAFATQWAAAFSDLLKQACDADSSGYRVLGQTESNAAPGES